MATFNIGLTMAGAISAGAYTGGVFDFLLQALAAWEARKRELTAAGTPPEEWDVPCHDVVIPVMSGASAGGITGALGLVALADEAGSATRRTHRVAGVGDVEAGLSRLYRAWVQMPRFVDPAGGADLLGTDDLTQGPVTSLLDTTILTRIVEASLLGIGELAAPKPYLAEPLHLFLTHSNLRGVPYEIGFAAGTPGQPGYGMMSHGDRAHFAVSGVGTASFQSSWARPDPARPIDVRTLPALASVGGDWHRFAEAALGTGAFPLGLSAREIGEVTVGDYERQQWPIARFTDDPGSGERRFRLPPKFPDPLGADPGNRVDYVTVDGGLINNEPFELARWTLMRDPPAPNAREPETSRQAVIMIDPFPEAPAYDAAGTLEATLTAVIKRLFPTLKDQARFKPADLADALDENVFSRFLIAPRRRAGRGAPLEPYAIACGLLGGFGGFLSEAFRAHDYQLGRLNCYLFLKESLALPLDNVVLGEGYLAGAKLERYRPSEPTPGDPRDHYQLIPLVGSAAAMPTPPSWPRVTPAEVETMVARADGRAGAVASKLIQQQIRSRLGRLGARLVWQLYGKTKIADYVRRAVLQDLYLRDQIEGQSASLPHDARRVLSALADPAYDFRTAAGIAREHGLADAVVTQALARLSGDGVLHEGDRTRDNRPTYTLAARRPGWLKRLPVLKQLDAWLWSGEPVVD